MDVFQSPASTVSEFSADPVIPFLIPSATLLSSVTVLKKNKKKKQKQKNETCRISSRVPVLFQVIDNHGRWESVRIKIGFPSKTTNKKKMLQQFNLELKKR